MRKRVLCHMRTTKAQIRLRIRAFVVRYLDSIISLDSITKFSRLELASVAEQVSVCLAWSETPEDTFSHGVAHMYLPDYKAEVSDDNYCHLITMGST